MSFVNFIFFGSFLFFNPGHQGLSCGYILGTSLNLCVGRVKRNYVRDRKTDGYRYLSLSQRSRHFT